MKNSGVIVCIRPDSVGLTRAATGNVGGGTIQLWKW